MESSERRSGWAFHCRMSVRHLLPEIGLTHTAKEADGISGAEFRMANAFSKSLSVNSKEGWRNELHLVNRMKILLLQPLPTNSFSSFVVLGSCVIFVYSGADFEAFDRTLTGNFETV